MPDSTWLLWLQEHSLFPHDAFLVALAFIAALCIGLSKSGLAGTATLTVVLMAKAVDGVYTDDPKTHPDAMRFQRISFDEAIGKKLKVMDATALTLCRDQKLPICVFSIFKAGALRRVVLGEDEGTLVHA